MRTFEEIRKNFHLGDDEEEMLRRLAPLVEPQADQIVEDFYQYLLEIPYAAKFLQDPDRVTSLKRYHRAWLMTLFQGPFNEAYFQRLMRIGQAHLRIKLSAHFVYVAMNFVRERLKLILSDIVPAERETACAA